MPTFPISHDATWADPSGKGFHIHSVAHVTSQGQLYLEVTTSTNSWGLGFTGGTAALVKAADGTVIWASQLRLAGVDAKSVFWGRSSRVDKYWNEWVPSDKLSQADSLEFVLGHNPHDRWAEDWKKFGDGVGQAAASVVQVIDAVKKVLTDVKVA